MNHVKYITLRLISICIIFCFACASQSVKTEIKDNPSISGLTQLGILIRLADNSRIKKEEQLNNISCFLSDYKQEVGIKLIYDSSKEIDTFTSRENRFYQNDDNQDFFLFKSIGLIKLYVQKNISGLKKILSDNNLNSLLIYEIYNIISSEMQFMDYSSVSIILDKNLNIIYLDHQSEGFDSKENDFKLLKSKLMDKLSERLIKRLLNLDFIEES